MTADMAISAKVDTTRTEDMVDEMTEAGKVATTSPATTTVATAATTTPNKDRAATAATADKADMTTAEATTTEVAEVATAVEEAVVAKVASATNPCPSQEQEHHLLT